MTPLEPLIPALDIATAEKDLQHLGSQIVVGEVLMNNPEVLHYLRDQINHINRGLLDASILGQAPELVKAHYLQCVNQIRAFEHLFSLATNLEINRNLYHSRTTK